jgi:hypothetical protein
MSLPSSTYPPEEPRTPEEIDAALRADGYDPATVRRNMQQFADQIIARERMKRIEAWLDHLYAKEGGKDI